MLLRRAVCVGVVFILAGCQSRLSLDKIYHLDAGTVQTMDIDPPRYEEKVVIAIETDAPVTAHLYLKRDADAVDKDLTLKQKSDKTLADWSGDKSGSLTATIPAHQFAILRIEATKKPATVKVKIKGN